jgi:hypothetical protein
MPLHAQRSVDHHLLISADADTPEPTHPGIDAVRLDVDRYALARHGEKVRDLGG